MPRRYRQRRGGGCSTFAAAGTSNSPIGTIGDPLSVLRSIPVGRSTCREATLRRSMTRDVPYLNGRGRRRAATRAVFNHHLKEGALLGEEPRLVSPREDHVEVLQPGIRPLVRHEELHDDIGVVPQAVCRQEDLENPQQQGNRHQQAAARGLVSAAAPLFPLCYRSRSCRSR